MSVSRKPFKGHGGGTFIPKITEKKTRRLLDREDIVPVDANEALWNATLSTIPEGRPIVAYCQSAGCKFAENVSVRLIEEGFTDISIFRDGWVEWVKKHGKDETIEREAKEDNG